MKEGVYPSKAICPWCKKAKIFEPHSFAVLECGAYLMNRKRDVGVPDKKMDGFLSLIWHGAHNDGKGKDREIDCMLDVVSDVTGGQFGIYFCSTRCLRGWLNAIIDELESKIQKQSKE
ncbi:MAG: hypothetical protein HZC12_06665 [Nitrospirae bacterium]|nr:hypothetical protein [Nitrospirota bacterium]